MQIDGIKILSCKMAPPTSVAFMLHQYSDHSFVNSWLKSLSTQCLCHLVNVLIYSVIE